MPLGNQTLVSPLEYAAAVVTLLTFVYAVYQGLRVLFWRTIGSAWRLRRRLDRLACGVSDEFVRAQFGAPAFTWSVPSSPAPTRWWSRMRTKPGHAISTYDAERVWVTTITQHSAVIAWSVTVKHRRFHWNVARATFDQLHFRIAKDHFGKLPIECEGRYYSYGARRAIYAEALFFGNPGGYQTYVLANSDAGVRGGAFFAEGRGSIVQGIFAQDSVGGSNPAHLQQFRRSTVANTLTVFAPDADYDVIRSWDWLGVDLDRVRLLYVRPPVVSRIASFVRSRWRKEEPHS